MTNELRERIARAIIGAAGTNGPTQGALLSARRQANRVIKALGLTEEVHPAPVWVPDYHEDGSPVMDERWVQPMQKHHIEWVDKARWTTPWEEVGERETSEQFSARLEANKQ